MTSTVLHVAPLVKPLSESPPGGGEHCVRLLASAQARAGMSVGVVACSGSTMPEGVRGIDLGIQAGALVPIAMIDLAPERHTEAERKVFEPVLDFVRRHGGEFDVIHNHAFDFIPLFGMNEAHPRIVHTLHLPPILPWVNEKFSEIARSNDTNAPYVTVSNACADMFAERTGFRPAVIYNGIDMKESPFAESPGTHALWVGRISPEKGLDEAIRIVVSERKTPLTVIGPVYDKAHFKKDIEPHLSHPLIRYLGPQSNETVRKEMARAKCLVVPIRLDEAFGLVFVEALSCGTPVITYRRGAAPEIIEDGVTGFLVNSPEEFDQALDRIGTVDRRRCRESVEEKFSIGRMVEAYSEFYRLASAASSIYRVGT